MIYFFSQLKNTETREKNVGDSFIMIIWMYTSADEFRTLSIYIKTCKNLGNHSRETKIIYKESFIKHFFLQNTKIVVLHEYIIYEKNNVFTESHLKTFRILSSTNLRNQFCFATCLMPSPIKEKPFPY